MPASAQEAGLTFDPDYVLRFYDKFHLRLVSHYEPMFFRVKDRKTENQVIYRHNARPLFGIGAIIADIQLLAAFKLPESFSRDADVYGKPDFRDFQVNLNGKRLVGNFDYQFRRGFYVAGTKGLPQLSSPDLFILPGLSTEGYSLNLAYVFNPAKFSYRAIITHHDKQKKGAGSFILMSSIKYFRVFGDDYLVAPAYRQEFSSGARLYNGDFTGFALMPGYSHTFTLGDFYLNLGLALGPDLQYNEFRTGEHTRYQWKVEPMTNFRGGIGYDNGSFFTGLYGVSRWNRYTVGDLNLMYDSGYIRFSAGHRFQETPWMQAIRNSAPYQWVQNLF